MYIPHQFAAAFAGPGFRKPQIPKYFVFAKQDICQLVDRPIPAGGIINDVQIT